MMYSIGQILFIVLSKKNQVYPMQVVEVITKKMMSGEDVSYVLQAGADKATKVTLDQVDGEVFDTADKARRTLIQRATSQINKLVDHSITKASEWYGLPNTRETPQMIQDLPDLMSTSADSAHQQMQTPTRLPQEDAAEVRMPDGSIVKVRLPEIMKEAL